MFFKICVLKNFTNFTGKHLCWSLRAWNFIQKRSSHLQIFFKINVLKNFANFTGKHLCWILFLIKFLTNFVRDTLTQVFSCEIWKNCKNTFSTEHLQWLHLSKRLQHRYLPAKFAKFLRTSFFAEHRQWLPPKGHFFPVRLRNYENRHDLLLISCVF